MVPVTAIYAALGALLVLALGFNVSWRRRTLGVGLGSGGEERLRLAIRAHANAVEWLPTSLLLLLLLELNGGSSALLHGFGIALLVARLGHAEGLLRHGGGVSVGRFCGTLVTWVVIGLMALRLLWLAVA